MIDRSRIFENGITQDAEGAMYQIFNLCQVGIAASETCSAIDLSKGGHDALYQMIAVLAEEAAERLGDEQKAAKVTNIS